MMITDSKGRETGRCFFLISIADFPLEKKTNIHSKIAARIWQQATANQQHIHEITHHILVKIPSLVSVGD